jgi:hypothetical protein
MAGLLDALTDPEFMKQIEERRLLVQHVAGQLNLSEEEARYALDTADAIAAETFCEGNVVPFRARH